MLTNFTFQFMDFIPTHIMSNLRQIQEKNFTIQNNISILPYHPPKQYAPKKPVGNCNIDGGNSYISVTA
jgi:hypothetical protein